MSQLWSKIFLCDVNGTWNLRCQIIWRISHLFESIFWCELRRNFISNLRNYLTSSIKFCATLWGPSSVKVKFYFCNVNNFNLKTLGRSYTFKLEVVCLCSTLKTQTFLTCVERFRLYLNKKMKIVARKFLKENFNNEIWWLDKVHNF